MSEDRLLIHRTDSPGYTVREDGSTIIWTGNDAIMLTPDRGGMIVVTGRREGSSPFDTVPSALSWPSVAVLRDALAAALEDRR